jgi:hypothetical protein
MTGMLLCVVNPSNAKLEIDATTLRPQDASEGLPDWVAKEPGLAEWAEKRAEFDEQVSAVYGATAIPAGLRDRILKASTEVKTSPARRVWLRPVLAIAACVALCAVIFLRPSSGMPAWQVEALRAAVAMESGETSFEVAKGTLEGIKGYLKGVGAKVPGELPAGLAGAHSLGCKRVQIGGHAGVVICFMLESGKEAHLIVIDSGSLPGMPAPGKAEFNTEKEWSLATWTDGVQSYFLASTEDTEELRKLMGQI